MILDTLGKVMWLDHNDVRMPYKCPVCGVVTHENGTGPANRPWLTKILHDLWSEDYLGGICPEFHDRAYRLCSAGWTIAIKYGNKVYTAHNKETADKVYLRLMLARVRAKTKPGVKRDYLEALAYRNYMAVHSAGESSYGHNH